MYSKNIRRGAGVLLFALFAGSAASGRTLSFGDNRRDYAVGHVPVAAAAADFNSDGIPDLAVTNSFDNNVSILLGDGTGNLQTQQYAVASGLGPGAIAAGDMNGDGIQDIVVANVSTRGVSVLLGKGNGTFRQPKTVRGVVLAPNYVAVSDFNRDGKPDVLLIGGSGPNAVAVLLGNGDGTLQPALYSPTGGPALNAVVADFSDDGIPDVAVTIYGSSKVSILVGGGNGMFAAPRKIETGAPVSSIAAGHYNADHYFDLLVACGSQPARVLWGASGARFLAPVVLNGTAGEMAVATDVNLDGISDPLVVSSAGAMYVTLGTATDSFEPALSSVIETGYISAISTNLNGDGTSDVVAVNSNANVVSVLLGSGTESFPTAPGFAATNVFLTLSADFNKDGIADLLQADTKGLGTLWLGNGNGGFTPGVSLLGMGDGWPIGAMAVGDLNGDGWVDAIVCTQADQNPSEFMIYQNDKHGHLVLVEIMAAPAGFMPFAGAIGDFTGDGKGDVVLSGLLSSQGTVLVYVNKGTAFTFNAPSTYATTALPVSVALSDFNEDGKLDAAVAEPAGAQVQIFMGNGTGGFTFGDTLLFSLGSQSPATVMAGDFNGDHHVDFATANQVSNNVTVYLAFGGGVFGGGTSYPTLRGTNYGSAVTADFDGDGILDLAVGNMDPTVTLLHGRGDGTFDPPVAFGVDGQATSLAAGDFTGDGKIDLAVDCLQPGIIKMLYNTSQP